MPTALPAPTFLARARARHRLTADVLAARRDPNAFVRYIERETILGRADAGRSRWWRATWRDYVIQQALDCGQRIALVSYRPLDLAGSR